MASYQYIYVMKGLNKTFPGGKQVLKDIWLSFLPGAKIGVLGLNGAGKSTLLKVMSGEDDNFTGEAWAAEGVNVGFLKQEPELNEKKDVLGNVMEGAGEMATDALRCPPSDSAVDKLSGGEKRRVALCRLLLSKPDMLLLDEPTNHLDAESVAWLARHLAEFPGTVVAVTHDRYFLDNVAGWILELDRGAGIPWEGNYSSWLKQKDQRLALEEKTESARRRTLAWELEWARLTPSARRGKPRARLNRYEALLAEDRNVSLDKVQIHIPAGPRLGDVVVQARGLRKAYGDRLLIDGLDFALPPAGIVGIIGANGAGKTTLLRMVTGEEGPDAGALHLGETVELAYVDQSRDALDPDKTIWEEISGGDDQIMVGDRKVASRAYVAGFNFRGTDEQK